MGSTKNLRAMGIEERKKGNLGKAISLFEGAIKENPQDFWSYHLLGCVFNKKGETEKAISIWKRALNAGEIGEQHFRTYSRLGHAYKTLGDINNSIYYLQQSMLLNPEQPKLEESLAQLYQFIQEKR